MRRLLLAAAFAALASPALAADKLTLLLDWFVNPNHAPIIVAQEKGFFKKRDLEMEIVAPADPSLPPKLVAAGKADLAVDYQSQLYLEHQEGLPLKRVGTLAASPLGCLLVRDDGSIKSIKDLKGKTIGYSTPGVDEASVEILLKSAGLTLKDVTMVNVNWALSQALLTRQADAVTGASRNFQPHEMAIAGTPGKCFFAEDLGAPAQDELIFVANLEKANKDALKRFFAALSEAALYLLNHPDESWAAFIKAHPDLDDELNRRAWKDTLGRHALAPAALDHARYKAYSEWLVKQGTIKAAPKVSDIAVDLNAE